ncbi:MAG: inorganic phosphate transporter, partial [Elusimicrobia bacterium]|nr:inorganic phosphate transporter [Elusimicrobiota bacterium]
PVSTTHVSTGAIFGIGFWRGGQGFQWGMVKGILLAWLVTLPCSALLGIGAYWLFS